MHHLRRNSAIVKPLFSLAGFYIDLAAARASHGTPAGLSRSLASASFVSNTQQATWELSQPDPHLQRLLDASKHSDHVSSNGSRGFAAQSASRLKQSANRAKRIAQQQHGGRQPDPTSNESVATIPQEHSTVETSQGQASQLQVSFCHEYSCCTHFTAHMCMSHSSNWFLHTFPICRSHVIMRRSKM